MYILIKTISNIFFTSEKKIKYYCHSYPLSGFVSSLGASESDVIGRR